ncbi:hypothetical protein TKK_0000338 [Trichogramma kaykai]|uniref:Alcohol dehydrogenase n=1 Tax=Trichogramma kaykai TaxID=54128 RepID=A0ABD2W7A7_9HYME
MNIEGKVVIITGGMGGMGYETAKALLKNGAKFIAIFDLPGSADEIDSSSKGLFATERAKFFPGDISIDSTLKNNFDRVVNDQGCVDIVINNAGIINEQNIQLLVDLNVKAVLSCSLLALTHMGKHKGGHGGLIVNVNAILGLTDCPLLPFYSATKHAIIGFTRCMKNNFNSTGVRVVSICPGVTKTNLFRKLPENLCDFISDTIKEKVLTEVPVQSTTSVADAIVEIIKKGESGAVWVVENDKKPYAIKPVDHYVNMSYPI